MWIITFKPESLRLIRLWKSQKMVPRALPVNPVNKKAFFPAIGKKSAIQGSS
jgi:hypothetical protein